MITEQDIHELIAKSINCTHLEVYGPDQVHFQALIVSEEFAGKSLVQRHQLVYKSLGNKLAADIHAISLKTLTPSEWQK